MVPTKRPDAVCDVDVDASTLAAQKRELRQVQTRLPALCNELDETLKQLSVVKKELRNHRNYHQIIRLDAVETEIEERIKELARLKRELDATRSTQRSLDDAITETA